jgi:hypothetical protein
LERVICDYIAGMTDRFAENTHARLTGQSRSDQPTDENPS